MNNENPFLVDYIIKPFVEIALDRLTSLVSSKYSKNVTLNFEKSDTVESIGDHINYVNTWSSTITFNSINKPKITSSIYIPLNIYVNPLYTHIYEESPNKIEITNLVSSTEDHIVILGHPGAGKSTTIKHICQDIIQNSHSSIKASIPILVNFRDITDKNKPSIFQEILNIFSVKLVFNLNENEYQKELDIRKNVLIRFLNDLDCILLLDGFDEISTYQKREEILKEIRFLSENLNIEKCKFILTSRTGEFRYSLLNTSQFQLAPFNDEQIFEFIKKWLNDEIASTDLLNKIKKSPFYDTTVRPLIIAYLCAIYEKYKRIPDQPKNVYELVVNLLLNEWNEQWSIKRDTSFSQFDNPRKLEFLSQLAYILTTEYQSTKFGKATLIKIYELMCPNFNLPLNQSNEVIHELESHTGLLVQCGYDRFEFPHKSIQEFLAAKYLNSVPLSTQENILQYIPNELAVSTSISINPTIYLYSIVFEVLRNKSIHLDFFVAFINRLIVERPHFTLSPLLALSIIFTIKEYLKISYNSAKWKRQPEDFKNIITECETHFKDLLCNKIIKDSFIYLLEFYDDSKIVELKYGLKNEFICFKNKKNIDDKITHFKVPREIDVPMWIKNYY